MRLLFTVILVLMFNSHLLFSQSQYLPEGHGIGFSMSGGVASGKDASATAVAFGLTDGKSFEIGLGYDQTKFSQSFDGPGNGISLDAFVPYVNLFTVNNKTDIISPSLNLAYYKYFQDDLADPALSATLSVFHVFDLDERLSIAPEWGVNKTVVMAGGKMPPLSYIFGFTFIISRNSSGMFAIAPSFSFDKHQTALGIDAGFVFSVKK